MATDDDPSVRPFVRRSVRPVTGGPVAGTGRSKMRRRVCYRSRVGGARRRRSVRVMSGIVASGIQSAINGRKGERDRTKKGNLLLELGENK